MAAGALHPYNIFSRYVDNPDPYKSIAQELCKKINGLSGNDITIVIHKLMEDAQIYRDVTQKDINVYALINKILECMFEDRTCKTDFDRGVDITPILRYAIDHDDVRVEARSHLNTYEAIKNEIELEIYFNEYLSLLCVICAHWESNIDPQNSFIYITYPINLDVPLDRRRYERVNITKHFLPNIKRYFDDGKPFFKFTNYQEGHRRFDNELIRFKTFILEKRNLNDLIHIINVSLRKNKRFLRSVSRARSQEYMEEATLLAKGIS